jgi:hypothetical protein
VFLKYSLIFSVVVLTMAAGCAKNSTPEPQIETTEFHSASGYRNLRCVLKNGFSDGDYFKIDQLSRRYPEQKDYLISVSPTSYTSNPATYDAAKVVGQDLVLHGMEKNPIPSETQVDYTLTLLRTQSLSKSEKPMQATFEIQYAPNGTEEKRDYVNNAQCCLESFPVLNDSGGRHCEADSKLAHDALLKEYLKAKSDPSNVTYGEIDYVKNF